MHTARTVLQHRTAVAFMLMAALLFAQWAGLSHRIEHGPIASVQMTDEHASGHSCVAFDAAAVADAIHLPPFVAPLLTSASVLALWAAFDSWDAPLVLHFSSRAPPLA